MIMALTFSPDPAYLAAGPGTAAQQTARPRMYADHANGGYDPAATGATAGTPGTFTPVGAKVPADRAALAGVTASPATAWTGLSYVVTADTQESYWNGTAWVAGRSPTAVGGEERGTTDEPARRRK